jgi:glycosyltransferase involved in cell wall biosynthesis
MNNPLASLCCSTYSRPDLFEQTLSSLLRQRYEPLEIVVLADGANQESIRLLESAGDNRLRWFTTEKPSGMIPAWNRVAARTAARPVLAATRRSWLTFAPARIE